GDLAAVVRSGGCALVLLRVAARDGHEAEHGEQRHQQAQAGWRGAGHGGPPWCGGRTPRRSARGFDVAVSEERAAPAVPRTRVRAWTVTTSSYVAASPLEARRAGRRALRPPHFQSSTSKSRA